jgi:hypothetical protein
MISSNHRLWLCSFWLLAVGLLPPRAFVRAQTVAATVRPGAWYVDGVNGNDGNNCQTPETACKTIGHAISLASSGDSIIVEAGTYIENLTIGSSLKMIGSGASTTIIDGNAAGTVLTIPAASAQVTLSNITIRNGGLTTFGGGIDNWGTLTINNTTVSENLAFQRRNQPGYGGGIYNHGRTTINNSTISGNRALCANYCTGEGGGILNVGSLTINNSTITGNYAGGFGVARGGGIYNNGGVTINNSTINGNGTSGGVPGQGGGIWNNSGSSAVLQNSIVANSVRAGNCYGGVTSHGYNLSSDGTCNLNNTGDLNNHDPMLGPLQNNGGPTPTMALLSGSPAIDAGNPSGCTDGQGQLLKTDQRGQPRPDKEDTVGCDMGAFESQSD